MYYLFSHRGWQVLISSEGRKGDDGTGHRSCQQACRKWAIYRNYDCHIYDNHFFDKKFVKTKRNAYLCSVFTPILEQI
jgi:hypothetical protein